MKTYSSSSMKHSNHNQRMLPFYKIIMWMSVFLLFFTVEKVYSQSDTLNCATSDSCIQGWSLPITIIGNMGSGIKGVITYRKRWCNGVDQIIVDNFHAYDNGLYLDTLNVYHYNFSAFSDLVDVYILQRRFGSITATFQSPKVVAQIYKANCGIFVKCTYTVDSLTKYCDCVDGEHPSLTTDRFAPIDIYKWQSCGIVCCKKTYEIYRGLGAANLNVIKIKSISIEKSEFYPKCTLENNFTKPCENGC